MIELHDHWAETAHLWRPGVPVLTWHVVFEVGSPARELAARLAPELTREWLDRVPPAWLHLTTQGVGLEPDVRAHTWQQIVEEARARLAGVPPIGVSLGPARVEAHGVGLRATGPAALAAMRERLQDADAAVRGRPAVPDWRAPFHPHVTLAYASRRARADELAAALAARGDTVAVTVREVALLRLHRDERLYRWDVMAAVPLGGVRP